MVKNWKFDLCGDKITCEIGKECSEKKKIAMKDTKRAQVIRLLKQQVLAAEGGISRAEAAGRLGIDLRTAASYLEQLTECGLLYREKVVSGGKGRPCSIYRSNADNLCFLGLRISSSLRITGVLIDSRGRELKSCAVELEPEFSRLSAFNAILGLVRESCKELEGKVLYGIGLAISRWLQPPLAGEDVYANLVNFLRRETGVAVYRDVIINVDAFLLARQLNCRNLALIHAGDVIEFGLVRDGVPVSEFSKREEWLSHICVKPDGRRCYCGKYGCFENYVTSGSRRELFNSSSNRGATQRALGEMLGAAMVRLVRKFPVDAIIILDGSDMFFNAEDYFSVHSKSKIPLIRHRVSPNGEQAAAFMAAYFELHRYTGDE